MIGQFEYKDTHSEVHGVYFKSVKRPLMASLKSKMIEISSASGSYDFGDNEYDNVEIRIRIKFIPTDVIERKQRARNIASWLNSEKWEKLILGDEPDKYYLARVKGKVDLEKFISSGEANVTFICQPFAYMVADTAADVTWDEADFPWITAIPWDNEGSYNFVTTEDVTFTFDNPGTKATNYKSPQGSKFDVVITGSFTTLSIGLNNKVINYNEAVSDGTVTIDNFDMEVDLDGTNKLSVISGDIATFLEAIPGDNELSITGIDLDVEVTIDFKPMWI